MGWRIRSVAMVGGVIALLAGLALVSVANNRLPAIGAGGLLHPARHHVAAPRPDSCHATSFEGVGVTLEGWKCPATSPRRGTIVYLHGIADNRGSSVAVIRRFGPRGFDVIAYDSRAHGDSGGDACTYGFFEKQDLHRVLDVIDQGPIVLMGASLGAAVALQEAADDPRVRAVVAVETFSDLRTVATERAPLFFTPGVIRRAFQLAEEEAHLRVDSVSPTTAATRIAVPVLLVHGDADSATPPAHSKRVFAALQGPKRLILVPGAEHNQSLRPEVWDEIERWIDTVSGAADPRESFASVVAGWRG